MLVPASQLSFSQERERLAKALPPRAALFVVAVSGFSLEAFDATATLSIKVQYEPLRPSSADEAGSSGDDR
jgi:hypothetical protein